MGVERYEYPEWVYVAKARREGISLGRSSSANCCWPVSYGHVDITLLHPGAVSLNSRLFVVMIQPHSASNDGNRYHGRNIKQHIQNYQLR